MGELIKEKYWEVNRVFTELPLTQKVRFLNNMTDYFIKRGDVEQIDGFLIEIPKEETHIIPIKYNQDTHYSTLLLNKFKQVDTNSIKKSFTITGNQDQTPVEILLHDVRCWIKQGELDTLINNNIDLEKIKLVTYNEGLISPYIKIDGVLQRKCIDAYELELLWND